MQDSAACLVRDGRIVAAVAEERLSRIKHDAAFPVRATLECLRLGDARPDDVGNPPHFETWRGDSKLRVPIEKRRNGAHSTGRPPRRQVSPSGHNASPGRITVSVVRQRFVALRTPVVRYEQGACEIVADLATAVGLGLYRYGYFDPDIEIVKRLLRPGDTFVAGGGENVGLFALAAASRVGPGGCVIAFEP